MKNLPAGSVLVLQHLLPSDVVSLSRRAVAAIVVESLGQGSHAALLAREKSLPTVADFPGVLERIGDGDEVLVDAYRGEIVLAPDGETRAEFHERLTQYQAMLARCKGACRQPARTLDGELVKVEANLGAYDDVELALDNGADGVGLFRLEQLYLARELPPTEAELLDELRAISLRCGTRRLPSGSSTSAATSPFRFCTFRQRPIRSLVNAACACCWSTPNLRRLSSPPCCACHTNGKSACLCQWSHWKKTFRRCESCSR